MNTRIRIKAALTFTTSIATLVLASTPASAVVLVYEPFAYPDGGLTGQGGAIGTTGNWTADETFNGDWRVHQEGDQAGIVVSPGPPVVRGMFDGTVDNLPTFGGYVGLPGPEDVGEPDLDRDFEIGRNLDASIALAPNVTASFQPGSTTWFSYVAAKAWDRNEETPNLTIGTDPSPSGSRAASLINAGSGIGTGGGPPRNERTNIYPMFFDGGNVHTVNGAPANFQDDATGPDVDGEMIWQENDADGNFGAPNVVVGRIQWDADTSGEDIISVVRFLEDDTLSEAAFSDLIAAIPNLSSANWAVAANKPNLDQSQFDTLNIAGLKFFVDEIRIGTTFEDVTGAVPIPEPSTLVLAALGLLGLVGFARRRKR